MPTKSFHFSDPFTQTSAQAMIDSYEAHPISGLATLNFTVNIQQLQNYFDSAAVHNTQITDVEVLFARKPLQQGQTIGNLTLVVATVTGGGNHFLFNNDFGDGKGPVPCVLENCTPCPPPAGCSTLSEDLSQ